MKRTYSQVTKTYVSSTWQKFYSKKQLFESQTKSAYLIFCLNESNKLNTNHKR